MSLAVLTPSSTVNNTGDRTGGSTVHGVLSDSSNATYMVYDALELSTLGLSDASPAIPAGSVVTAVILYAKCATTTGNPTQLSSQLVSGSDSQINVTIVTNSTPALIAVNTWAGNDFADADIDALTASVGCVNPTNDLVVYDLYVQVAYTVTPTLSVYAPTGTITDHNLAEVYWTPTFDRVSGSQIYGSDAKIFDSATYSDVGFDPETSVAIETVTASGSMAYTAAVFSVPLANDTYRGYVKVTHQIGTDELVSDWEYTEFTIDVPLPAVPTLTLTPDDELARISVGLADNTGDATTDYFEVERSDDGGAVTFGPVRAAYVTDLIPVADGGVFDYEAPNNITVTYRARAIHDYGADLRGASAWVEATTSWGSQSWWIKHPTRPDISRSVTLRSHPDRNRPARQGIFQAISGTGAIVVSNTRGTSTGSLVLLSSDQADKDALDDLLDAGIPLLLQGPPNHYEPDRWVVFGDHTRTRIIDKGWSELVDESIPWTEVDRPSNAQLPGLFPAVLLIP